MRHANTGRGRSAGSLAGLITLRYQETSPAPAANLSAASSNMRQLRKHAPAVPLSIAAGTIHSAIMKPDNLTVLGEFLHKRDSIDPARVTPETSLEELRVDSLLLLEVLFEFEDRLGIKIPRDIRRPKTVGDLLEIVDKLQAGKGV